MGQWSELPVDLLRVIEEHLVLYIDKVRFRSICLSWRSAVPKLPNHKIPWLLLPYGHNSETCCGFVSPLETKLVYQLELHDEAQGKLFRGSSHGWVVTVEKGPAMYLINPLTRVRIQLPPRSRFPDVRNYRADKHDNEYAIWDLCGRRFYTIDSTHVRDFFLAKVVLSSSPTSSDDYVVVAIYGEFGRLAYCRSGDKKWSFLHGYRTPCKDVIFHKGKLYALDCWGRLVVCEIDPCPKVTEIVPPQPKGNNLSYLVEYSGGLMMVERKTDMFHCDESKKIFLYKTCGFNIYELDPSGSSWCQVKNLGDNVLFLGLNSSLSFSSEDIPGCKGNCIYFTDNNFDVVGGFDVGVFNLDDGSIEPLPGYRCDPYVVCPRAVWVTP